MPKLKTKSAVKKRFSVTATGKVKFKKAFARHMMRNKSQKMKRQARGTTIAVHGDEQKVLGWMPYARKSKRRTTPMAANLNTQEA
jgi:large subunit ribosomal protein L35